MVGWEEKKWNVVPKKKNREGYTGQGNDEDRILSAAEWREREARRPDENGGEPRPSQADAA